MPECHKARLGLPVGHTIVLVLALYLTTILVAPAWAADVSLPKTAANIVVVGNNAPADVTLLPPKQMATLRITGPATVQLVFYGLGKGNKKVARTGGISMRVDGAPAQRINLSTAVAPGWRLAKRPAFRVTDAVSVPLDLVGGEHTINLKPFPQTKGGYLLHAVVTRPASVLSANNDGMAPPPPPEPFEEVPLVETALALSSNDDDDFEPDLIAPQSADDEVPLALTPSVALAVPDSVGFQMAGAVPKPLAITSKTGVDEFYWLNLDDGMALDVVGPGTLVVDFHAHRDKARPETQAPIVVALLLDDVLAQTLSLNQTQSAEFSTTAGFELGKRVTLRLPIPAGAHSVRFTLSDAAVLGVSARPSFEGVGKLEAPTVLTAQAAREHDLVANSNERDGGVVLRIGAGGLQHHDSGAQGALIQASLGLGVPLGHHLVLIELLAGYGHAQRSWAAPDPRSANGQSRAELTVQTVPVFLGVSWDAPLAAPLHFGIGVGGGALLSRVEMAALDARVASALVPTLAGMAHAQAGVDVGAGVLLLRVQGMAGRPVDVGVLRNADPGGVALLLSYAVGAVRSNYLP